MIEEICWCALGTLKCNFVFSFFNFSSFSVFYFFIFLITTRSGVGIVTYIPSGRYVCMVITYSRVFNRVRLLILLMAS